MKANSCLVLSWATIVQIASGFQYATSTGDHLAAQSHNHDLFIQGNESPNATNQAALYIPAPDGQSQQLTWRINVSSVAVTDATTMQNGKSTSLSGAQVVNTVHDLQWPGGGSLNDYLVKEWGTAASSKQPACATVLYMRGLPSNITDLLTTDNSGDCSKPLGQDCLTAISTNFKSTTNGVCPSVEAPQIAGCTSTLGLATSWQSDSIAIGYPSNATSGITTLTTQSGAGFYYTSTAAVTGSAASQALVFAENVFQMMILTIPGANDKTPAYSCQRVKPNATSTAPSSTSAAPTSTATGNASPERLAGVGMAGVLGMSALFALF